MPLELARVLDTDLETLSEIHHEAFKSNPHSEVVFHRTTSASRSSIENMTVRHRKEYANPDRAFVKVTDTATGEIAGFAVWHRESPKTDEGEEKPEEKRDWGPDTNVEALDEFIGALTKKRTEVMGGNPFWHLELLDTHPSYERRGVGSQLVKWGTDRADEDGLPAWLEATPTGYGLYIRHGFEGVGDLISDLTKHGGQGLYKTVFMLRPAREK